MVETAKTAETFMQQKMKSDSGILELEACRTYASRLDFCSSLQKQVSCLLLEGRLRSLPPPSMTAFLRYRIPCLRVAKMLTQLKLD